MDSLIEEYGTAIIAAVIGGAVLVIIAGFLADGGIINNMAVDYIKTVLNI